MKQLTLNIYYKNAFYMYHYYLNEKNDYGELNWTTKKDGSTKLLLTKKELKQLIADDQNLKTSDIKNIEIGA
jgi:hypothetical protein